MLCSSLQQLSDSQHLEPCYNHIRDDGARLLAASVRMLPRMRNLGLEGNIIANIVDLQQCSYTAWLLRGLGRQRQ